MTVVIDFDIATHYPKHMKRLYEALSDKRDIVHFISSMILTDMTKEASEEFISKNKDALTSKNRETLHNLGLFCVGFAGVVFGENRDEVSLQYAAYCKNVNADLFIGKDDDTCEAVKELAPDTLVLHVREVV